MWKSCKAVWSEGHKFKRRLGYAAFDMTQHTGHWSGHTALIGRRLQKESLPKALCRATKQALPGGMLLPCQADT